MSDIDKLSYDHADKTNGVHHAQKTLTTVTLSAEQFESLYLQPRIAGRAYSLEKTFGNPTPLGVASFLLAHTPLSMDLMGFRGATAASSVAMLGGFYACAGIGLYLACIMEWVMGNTFPSVVFGTFGGFWLSYAIINTPTMEIAASFAPANMTGGVTAAVAGASTPSFNVGLGMYFLVWGIMCVIYTIASLRTNVPFFIVFLSLVFAFELIAAAYFHTASGNLALAAMLFKVAGGFAFVTAMSGFYINLSLLMASVGYPFSVPLFDLSSRFMAPKMMMKDEEKMA